MFATSLISEIVSEVLIYVLAYHCKSLACSWILVK